MEVLEEVLVQVLEEVPNEVPDEVPDEVRAEVLVEVPVEVLSLKTQDLGTYDHVLGTIELVDYCVSGTI